jgi:hypothetical protein
MQLEGAKAEVSMYKWFLLFIETRIQINQSLETSRAKVSSEYLPFLLNA